VATTHRALVLRIAVVGAFLGVLAAPAPGLAQEGARPQAARPQPSPELNAITDVADALGMIRGTQREWKSVNRIYFVASGSLAPELGKAPQKVSRGFIEMSFAQHAIRADVTTAQGRSVTVAREGVAWNETSPGIGAKAAPGEAANRLWQNYTTPHGAVRAAMEAFVKDKASLKLSTSGQVKTFDFVSPAGPLRILADAKNRPMRTELTVQRPGGGSAKVVTEFSDYRDWEKLGVWFPARIRQSMDGAAHADLTISEFRTNPYVIFPYPPGMAPAGAAAHPTWGRPDAHESE
jgi:hypothetical protein